VLGLYDDVIIPAGNVGIGANNPQARLHIGGTAGVDGIMFPDGSLQKVAPKLACRRISAMGVNQVAVQCAADEFMTSCITTNSPSGEATCFPYGNMASTQAGVCGAWCGGGYLWEVTEICCKINNNP
jgi:hypothetical protein